jgi:hypothetical protein
MTDRRAPLQHTKVAPRATLLGNGRSGVAQRARRSDAAGVALLLYIRFDTRVDVQRSARAACAFHANGAPNNGLGTPPFVEEQQSGPASRSSSNPGV